VVAPGRALGGTAEHRLHQLCTKGTGRGRICPQRFWGRSKTTAATVGVNGWCWGSGAGAERAQAERERFCLSFTQGVPGFCLSFTQGVPGFCLSFTQGVPGFCLSFTQGVPGVLPELHTGGARVLPELHTGGARVLPELHTGGARGARVPGVPGVPAGTFQDSAAPSLPCHAPYAPTRTALALLGLQHEPSAKDTPGARIVGEGERGRG